MPRLRSILFALVAISTTAIVHTQQSSDITVATIPSTEQVRAWLRSGDPRLIAWGAYFASKNHDPKAASIMLDLAERSAARLPNPVPGTYNGDAMSEILYALIQRNEIVPPKLLAAIATSYPDQAVILVSRLPIANSTSLLEKWYYSGEAVNDSQVDAPSLNLKFLARIAGMLLAKAPPPGFAANVLAKSQEHLQVYVVSNGEFGSGGSAGAMCGDGGGGLPPRGWPMLFFYELDENKLKTNDPLLIEAGGDRITWQLLPITAGHGSCFGVRSLNDETRYHLLAAMLGLQAKDMPWKLQQEDNIVWTSNEKFLLDLQTDIAAEEIEFDATVDDFYEKGLLTNAEASSVRPKLSVTVSDERKSPGSPLPRLGFNDPRTYYATSLTH